MDTKILPCTCESAFQDRRYGAGRRLHNQRTKHKDEWRCTVCATIRAQR